MTNYLQELHSKGLANADHTTLLLNCYTKLKDVSRLDQFIKVKEKSCIFKKYLSNQSILLVQTDTDLNFDLETAISVCRQAGYFEHAVYLAEKFQEHDMYLDIVIEDTQQYGTALQYIRKLGPHEADKNLQKYSKTLLCHLPHETTQLLIELCTGSLNSSSSNSSKDTATAKAALNNLPFSNSADVLEPPPTIKMKRLSYAPPSPRKFMPAFVDRPDCLTEFLEAVYDALWGNGTTKTLSTTEQEERKNIWNTLLELYLMENTRQVRQKALTLLQDDTVAYDTNQALVLCQLKQFDEGIVYLYEKTGMYTDILRYWMEKGGTDRVIEGVRKYGYVLCLKRKRDRNSFKFNRPKDPSLYPMVLTYFSSTPEVMEKSTQELLSVMKHIDEKDLLPPIQVVQALSRSNVATIGLLKGYIGKKIEHERRELKQASDSK